MIGGSKMVDMTKGSIMSKILNFAVFIFIGGLMQNLYLIIDSIILGQYVGRDALAAVGISTPINFVIIGFLTGVTYGFSICMSKSFGAKDFVLFRKYTFNSIVLCFSIGILFTVVLIFLNPYILRIINTPSELFELTHNFLLVLYLGCISNLFYNFFAATLRSIGNSKAPLVFLIISVGINTILVYFLVAVFHLGIIGSAFGTVISQGIASLLSFLYIRKKYSELKIKNNEKNININYIKQLVIQGFPMGLQFSFTGIGLIVVQNFLNSFNSNYIAGFSVSSRIQNITVYVFVALGSALSTFVSQNYGAKKFDRINKAVNLTVLYGIGFSIIAYLLVTIFGGQIALLFTKEDAPELVEAATIYFDAVAWAYPVLSCLIIYRNALQGYGFPIIAMCAGIVELVLRVVVVVFFTVSLGYKAICLSDSITWVVTAIFLFIAYTYLNYLRKKQFTII